VTGLSGRGWQDGRVPATLFRGDQGLRGGDARSRTFAVLLIAVLLLGGLLGGCARVRTALAVQPDDTVTGEIVIATPEKSPDDTGPAITVPPDLTSDVDVAAYRQEGYTGSVLTFSKLTFDQVSTLTTAAGAGGEKVQLGMRRAGGRVLVTGSVDLTTVSVDKADFQLKMSFPGQIVETNGETDGGTAGWTFEAGEVGDVTAVVAFTDPNAPSVVNWTLGLAGIVALAAGAVVLVARRFRNPPVSPPAR
jgi:hypothetical protein